MPAFTFEKLSPSAPRNPANAPVAEKRRRGIARMLGRFANMRRIFSKQKLSMARQQEPQDQAPQA